MNLLSPVHWDVCCCLAKVKNDKDHSWELVAEKLMGVSLREK